MSLFVPNTTVSILRGDVENSYGSTVPSNVPIAYRVPVALSETGHTGINQETGTTFNVNNATALVASIVTIQDGDRLLDENSGVMYEVTDTYYPIGSMFQAVPANLILRRAVSYRSA
jgi:hypothetical protein